MAFEAATNVDLVFPMFERQMDYMRAQVAGLYALDNCVGVSEDTCGTGLVVDTRSCFRLPCYQQAYSLITLTNM